MALAQSSFGFRIRTTECCSLQDAFNGNMLPCIMFIRSLTSNRSPRGLIYHPQTKAWTVRSRCQTRRWCYSKPDPPDLLSSWRRRPAITRLEARSRPTSHHMDPSDPPGHGNIGVWCSWAGWGWGQIVLAANRNGGMLRLITSCHDDDDDNVYNWRPSDMISMKLTGSIQN